MKQHPTFSFFIAIFFLLSSHNANSLEQHKQASLDDTIKQSLQDLTQQKIIKDTSTKTTQKSPNQKSRSLTLINLLYQGTEQNNFLNPKEIQQEHAIVPIHNNIEQQYALNCAPFIAIIGTAPTGPVGIAVGTVIATGWFINETIHFLRNKNKKKEQAPKKPDKENNNNGDNDSEDKKKNNAKPACDSSKKHPNGTYEENPKHHLNSKKPISKPPRDGQKALDDSIEVPETKGQRVAVQDKKIIVLKPHSPGKYHGYIQEAFNDLPWQIQNVLKKAKIVHPKTGKILK